MTSRIQFSKKKYDDRSLTNQFLKLIITVMNSNPRKSNRPLLPNQDNSPPPDPTAKCAPFLISDNPRSVGDVLP